MTKHSRRAIVLLLLVGIIPFTSFNILFFRAMYSPASLSDVSSVEEFETQLEIRITDLLSTYSIPGVAIAIISNNQTRYICAGYSDQFSLNKISKDTTFQIASMSKTQCAFAIMKLNQEGLIDLNTSVEDYLTRWSLPDSSFDNNKVTTKRILAHVAGLSVEGVNVGSFFPEQLPKIEDALTQEGVKVIVEPATEYRYSGGGFGILQLLIEEITGMPYIDYLSTEIFQPLGLSNTGTYLSEEIRGKLSNGFGYFRVSYPLFYSSLLAAAGHCSSIEDMANWCNFFLNGQSVLNSSTMEEMLTPVWGDTWGYTLGFNYYRLENGRMV